MLRRLSYLFRFLFRRDKIEQELDRELRFHLEMEAAKNLQMGMGPKESRREALRRFGGIDRAKETCREATSIRLVTELAQDIRFATRIFIKKPSVTAIAILTLALGIGANSAVFSLVDALVLRPLPFPHPERLVGIVENETQKYKLSGLPPNYTDFLAWERNDNAFESLGAYCFWRETLGGSHELQEVTTIRVTPNFFSLLGMSPALGRTFVADDLSNGPFVVLSHGFWRREFGGRPDAVGSPIVIDSKPYTVIGVMPPDFPFSSGEDVWRLLSANDNIVRRPNAHMLYVVGRIKAGVSRADAESELAAIRTQSEKDSPEEFTGVGISLQNLRNQPVLNSGSSVQTGLWVTLGAVFLVLLIACVNVASLQLARSVERRKEMAIRAALGSGRGRLMRQLLTESLLLSMTGAALGVLLALTLIHVFVATHPIAIPAGLPVSLDLRVVAFTIALSGLTGILFGTVPSWQASKLDLNGALKQAPAGGIGGGARRVTGNMLVIAEVSLAMVLLIGAGLLIESVLRWQALPPGFRTGTLLVVTPNLGTELRAKPDSWGAFYDRVLEHIGALPGVKAATLALTEPYGMMFDVFELSFEGRPKRNPGDPAEEADLSQVELVGTEYFEVLGIPLFSGRTFARTDVKGSQSVAIVNEALARRYFPDENPIGKRLDWGGGEKERWVTIVGVVGNVQYTDPKQPMGWSASPILFVPRTQATALLTILVRTDGPQPELTSAIRDEVRSIAPNTPTPRIETLDQVARDSVSQARFRAVLMGSFSGLALLLALVGIYGVLSQSVSHRTQEIGVRMALGAGQPNVMRMILGQGLILAAAGVAIGLCGAVAATRLLSSLLFGVRPTDPPTFAIVSLILISVAAIACYLPARRATRINPLDALRCE